MSLPVLLGSAASSVIDGGDAPELQTRVVAAIAASTSLFPEPVYLADAQITGVGVGPRWLVQLTFVNNSNAGTFPLSVNVVTFVRRAGNPVALDLLIDQVLLANPTLNLMGIKVDGGGAGRDYMALILLAPAE